MLASGEASSLAGCCSGGLRYSRRLREMPGGMLIREYRSENVSARAATTA